MAFTGTDNSTNLGPALSQLFQKELVFQYNLVAHTSQNIPAEPIQQGNAKNVAWTVLLNDSYNGFGQTGSAYNEGTAFNVATEAGAPSIVPCTLPWGLYRDGFSFTDQEVDEAAVSVGSAVGASIGIVRTKSKVSVEVLGSLSNVDLWTGTGSATTGAYVGAPNAIGFTTAFAASGTYASVNVANYPSWAANVFANGGVARALSFDLMSTIETTIFNACNDECDLISNSSNVYRKYELLFLPNTRYTNGEATLKKGTLKYGESRMIRDKDAPEANGKGVQAWINTKYVSRAFLPSTELSRGDVFKVEDKELVSSNGGDVMTPLALPVRIIPLARLGDYETWMVKTTWQLKVTRRNAQAYVSDLATV